MSVLLTHFSFISYFRLHPSSISLATPLQRRGSEGGRELCVRNNNNNLYF
jgi:hypothetical protein